jgi:hypothetical protein
MLIALYWCDRGESIKIVSEGSVVGRQKKIPLDANQAGFLLC